MPGCERAPGPPGFSVPEPLQAPAGPRSAENRQVRTSVLRAPGAWLYVATAALKRGLDPDPDQYGPNVAPTWGKSVARWLQVVQIALRYKGQS